MLTSNRLFYISCKIFLKVYSLILIWEILIHLSLINTSSLDFLVIFKSARCPEANCLRTAALSDIKLYYNARLIKTICYWCKNT